MQNQQILSIDPSPLWHYSVRFVIYNRFQLRLVLDYFLFLAAHFASYLAKTVFITNDTIYTLRATINTLHTNNGLPDL